MKKITLFSILCLLLTGCTANYNLKIEDNIFIETISGNVLNSEIKIDESQTDVNYLYEFINKDQPALIENNNAFFQKKLNKKNDSIDYTYNYIYTEDTINKSRILNNCFENFSFKIKDNKYYLMASGKFYCDYAKETKISISTEYKAILSNAKEENNNTFAWIIDKNNKDNTNLYITLDTKTKNTSKENTSSWGMLKTACFFIILILSAICIYITKKQNKEY